MGLSSHFTEELFAREEVFTRSIVAKLWEQGRYDLGHPLESCHQIETFCRCRECGETKVFKNHCDRFYCPFCASRLSYRRKLKLEWWASQVKEPKHLVLTARNRNSITKVYVQYFQTKVRQFRHTKLMSSVRGGIQSLEVTNEGKGWHLHCHVLLDGPFLDAGDIARTWAKAISQDFAIVKIKSVKDKAYLQEVVKYAVKGSELAAWSASDIVNFIEAFQGIRSFSTFGTLFKDQALRVKALDALGSQPLECNKCASTSFQFMTDKEWEWFQETGKLPSASWR